MNKENFKLEKQLEDAVCKVFESHGIDSLNTDYRGIRDSQQGVIVKAEHTGTDDHLSQQDGFWFYDTYRMNISVSVITIRQAARESVALSDAHWDKVAKIRYILSRKISELNEVLQYSWLGTLKPNSTESGITDDNLESTTMSFETVMKFKSQNSL